MRGGRAPGTTLRARSVPCRPLPVPGTLACRLLANKARFSQYFSKVSQNDEVSPKYIEKASHSPCFQNGLRNSPLDILRFPFSVAFSYKELMVAFWPDYGLYCQNDEVSPDVHPYVHTRKGRRYPHSHRSKLPLVAAPHLLSAVSRRQGPSQRLNSVKQRLNSVKQC